MKDLKQNIWFDAKLGVILLVLLYLLAFCAKAKADELSEAFATVEVLSADCASMGNACVSAREFSSDLNPALVAVTTSKDFKWGISPAYASVNFKNGPDIQGGSLSLSVALPKGVLQLSYTGAGSNRHTDFIEADGILISSSLDFDSLQNFGVQYGIDIVKNLIKKGDKLYIGAGYTYSKSKILSDLAIIIPMEESDPLAMDFYLNSKSRSHTYTAGAVYVPMEKISLGIAYSYTRTKTTNDTDIPVEIDSTPDEEKNRMNDLRIGASWKITDKLMLAGDYRHAKVNSNNFDQYYTGAEYCFHEALCVYGGIPNSGWSAGAGLYLEHGGINVAYQYDPYKQVRDDFGKARVVAVTGYLSF